MGVLQMGRSSPISQPQGEGEFLPQSERQGPLGPAAAAKKM